MGETGLVRTAQMMNTQAQSRYNSGSVGGNGSKVFRVHNPITNPIEYHVDNPYFINKMQSKYGYQ